jgi:hypothetical protein
MNLEFYTKSTIPHGSALVARQEIMFVTNLMAIKRLGSSSGDPVRCPVRMSAVPVVNLEVDVGIPEMISARFEGSSTSSSSYDSKKIMYIQQNIVLLIRPAYGLIK